MAATTTSTTVANTNGTPSELCSHCHKPCGPPPKGTAKVYHLDCAMEATRESRERVQAMLAKAHLRTG